MAVQTKARKKVARQKPKVFQPIVYSVNRCLDHDERTLIDVHQCITPTHHVATDFRTSRIACALVHLCTTYLVRDVPSLLP